MHLPPGRAPGEDPRQKQGAEFVEGERAEAGEETGTAEEGAQRRAFDRRRSADDVRQARAEVPRAQEVRVGEGERA